MPIRFLDMFAGIGGFRSGLERLGGFECVGYCEIDKYAKQAYDAMYGISLLRMLLDMNLITQDEYEKITRISAEYYDTEVVCV